MSVRTSRARAQTRLPENEKHIAKVALSREDFSRTLERERSRADRSDQLFSVLVLQTTDLNGSEAAEQLINKLAARIRVVDEIGWFDERRIGLLLPFTTASGARSVMERIRHMMK